MVTTLPISALAESLIQYTKTSAADRHERLPSDRSDLR
jgi:hypothetical protein